MLTIEIAGRWKLVAKELAGHIPFTAAGAVAGILVMVIIVYGHVSSGVSHSLFYTFHPVHVLLSALVTTAMYKLHRFDRHSYDERFNNPFPGRSLA
jgi:hypothetical protein